MSSFKAGKYRWPVNDTWRHARTRRWRHAPPPSSPGAPSEAPPAVLAPAPSSDVAFGAQNADVKLELPIIDVKLE